MSVKRIALGWALLLAAMPGARAGEPEEPEQSFTLHADILSREGKNVLYAIGNVYMQRGESIVTADAAVIWLAEREAYLEGHVVYRVGKSVMKSEQAYVHWAQVTQPGTEKTSTAITSGFLFHGDIRWKERPDEVPWHVRGNDIVQTGPKEFVVTGDAMFSSNLNHQPQTYFRASEIDLVANESIRATNVTYNVQGVGLPPSLQGWWIPPTYWPELYIPLGWQLPQMEFDFGTSHKFGTYIFTLVTYDLPKDFIPLLDTKVGVQLDYMTDRGIAYGSFFSYALEEALFGRLDFYRVPNDSGQDRTRYELGTTDRYRVRFFHSQDMPEGWEFDVEWQAWSDAGFQMEYFYNDYQSEKPIENRLYLKRSDGPFAGYAHYQWQPEKWIDTTEYRPQLGFNVFSYPVWGGLLYSGNIEIAHIRRRLSNLRLPHSYIFTELDPTDEEIAEANGIPYEDPENLTDAESDAQDDLIDAARDKTVFVLDPGDIRDRDDITLPGYRRRARDLNFIQRPLRNSYQEDLSDDRSFWRFNMYHELAYPFAAGIFHFDPYVGLRTTWYEKTLMGDSGDWRNILVAGTRVTTQFWRAWENAHSDGIRLGGTKILPLDVNGIRHVITPEFRFMVLSVSGLDPKDQILLDYPPEINQPPANPDFLVPHRPYQPVDSTGIAFGDVDYINSVTVASLGLRNRWQTRRQERIVDLIDLDVFLNIFANSDRKFLVDPDSRSLADVTGVPESELVVVGEEDPDRRRFGTGKTFADILINFGFNPIDGVYFQADTDYSITNDDAPDDNLFRTFNTSLLIATSELWQLYLFQRYDVDGENRIGGRLSYQISPKWRVAAGYVFRTNGGQPLETELMVTRDLHDWVFDVIIQDDRDQGEKVAGFRLRPKFLRALVSEVEYSRDITETEGVGAIRNESYQQYNY